MIVKKFYVTLGFSIPFFLFELIIIAILSFNAKVIHKINLVLEYLFALSLLKNLFLIQPLDMIYELC